METGNSADATVRLESFYHDIPDRTNDRPTDTSLQIPFPNL